jgi:prevent-host-death family protein
MVGPSRKPRMREVPLSEVKNDFSRFLREAEREEIVITRHGKPAGVLSALKRKTTGSSIGSRTIRVSCAASSGLEKAFGRVVAFAWRIWNKQQIAALRVRYPKYASCTSLWLASSAGVPAATTRPLAST